VDRNLSLSDYYFSDAFLLKTTRITSGTSTFIRILDAVGVIYFIYITINRGAMFIAISSWKRSLEA
jgi:hypothetical protein